MRKLTLMLTALLCLGAAQSALGATVNVTITAKGFAPDPVVIAKGDTVVWTNNDASARQVVANGGAFASPVLATGQTYSFAFANAGSFMYRDEFDKKLKGTIEVTDAPTVTIASEKKLIVFGGSTLLSGKISSKAANQTVKILATAAGAAQAKELSAVTASDGTWSLTVKPRKRTSYEAQWNGATSRVAVAVRPRIAFKLRSGAFITSVAPARPGKVVLLQRWSLSLKRWISVKKVTLNKRSRAKFRWKPRAGDYKVRVFMTKKQTGAGYAAGTSRSRVYVSP